jgi:hypothetical protein
MRLPGISTLLRLPKKRDCSHPADPTRRQITGQDSCRRPAKIIVAVQTIWFDPAFGTYGYDDPRHHEFEIFGNLLDAKRYALARLNRQIRANDPLRYG